MGSEMCIRDRLKIVSIYEKILIGIDFLNLHRPEVVEPLCSDGISWRVDRGPRFLDSGKVAGKVLIVDQM